MGDTIAKSLQERWIAFLTLIALSFGGIWLQNQWQATEKLEREMLEHMRYMNENFVTKDHLEAIVERINRNDGIIDKLRSPSTDHLGIKGR
jgi:hypothetical protein